MLLSGMISQDISARSHRLVDQCGLDSLSIFFCSRTSESTNLTYLFHRGVSEDAQHAYKHGRVFEDDPFTTIIEERERCGQLIRWGDKRLDRAASRANAYRQFINCHSIDVVGAWVQQVLPQFYLVIGAHCCPGGHRRQDVPMRLLEHETGSIGQLVLGQLLEESLAGANTGGMVQAAIAHNSQNVLLATDPKPGLTAREMEIAQLVGVGKQNKQIAYLAGISEFTVENHLRSIYRKLNVRNRAAMTAALFGGQTCQ